MDRKGIAYVGARRYWEDFASYQSRRVPRFLLEKVYKVAGLEMEFMEGDMTMKFGLRIREGMEGRRG